MYCIVFSLFPSLSFASECQELVESIVNKVGGQLSKPNKTELFDAAKVERAQSSLSQSFRELRDKFFDEVLSAKEAEINSNPNLGVEEKRQLIRRLRNPKSGEFYGVWANASSKAYGTEVGRLIMGERRRLGKKIEPFQYSFENARRKSLAFDKVSTYGKDPNLTHVFSHQGTPVLIQANESSKDGNVQRIAFINSNCKIGEFMQATTNPSGGTGFDYFSSKVCQSLPPLRRLANEVRAIENNRLYEGNQIWFRCEEQGGDSSSGCRCPNGVHINPFAQSCYAERKPKIETPKDKLISFLDANDTMVNAGFGTSKDFDDVNQACRYFIGHLDNHSSESNPPDSTKQDASP